jgi:hypothetical protein
MKNFVKALLTNRFGIVLAALNLCYFVSRASFNINLPSNNFDILMTILHVPAIALTFIPGAFIHFLFSAPYKFVYYRFAFPVFLFFVTFQWLFIAWAARKIAQKWTGK